MKFAAIALVAVVAAKGPKPTPEHKGELMKDMKYIAMELKEINGDLKKLDKIEWEKEENHRHHHKHHKHHKHPHHGKKGEEGQLKMDIIMVEQIVTGILKGAVNAEGFNDIATCMNDFGVVLGDAENAVKDFKAGGASNVIEGLKQVGDLLKYVKVGMTDCSNTKADWARLETLAAAISSPSSFVYHVGHDLIINGQEIFTDIATAVDDYESQKWELFGENVGKAAAKTILGANLEGDCRSSHSDKSSCDADAACSWCTSFAVKNACNSLADARSLPSAVFVCDKLDAENKFLY